jgi:phage minor structural protein
MDIRIIDKSDKTWILSNTVAFNYELTKEINKLPSINFSLTKYEESWKLIETEGYIYSADGLFVVKDISITDDEVEVYAVYDAEVFQYNHFPTVGQATGGLGSYAADLVRMHALQDWTYEYNIASGVQPATVSINWEEYSEEDLSIYDALQVIVGKFNAEFVIDNVSKTLYVYEAMHCGEYRGAYLVEGFNLTDSTISISTDDIVTRLYPYGKDDLDITSVNPTGREWIDNFTYTDKIIEGVWKDERYEIAQNLYDDAVALLESKCQPTVNFSLSMADMYAITGNTNFLIEVGDTVRLSIDGNESLQVVVKMITSEDDLENTQIELASKAGSLLDTIANLEDRSVSGSGGGGGGSTSWDAITGKPTTFPSTWETVSGKPTTFPPSAHNHDERYYTETEIDSMLAEKQNTLVSGTNIKTINGESVLGSGNIEIQGGGGSSALACCSANNSGSGTTPTSNTPTAVTLNRFNVNTDSSAFEFSSGGIKCKKSGTVQVNASLYLRVGSSSAATGTSGCYIYQNGAEIASNYSYTNAAYNTKGCTKIVSVNAGDVITLMSRTSAAGVMYAGNVATYLEIIYLA